ncbi:cAMP-binding domain of CRP or a regulatory subunit of cAMP-dependent protein kinases [Peptoniphilus asaccharolyticus DSM 20463]|uniref:cAMP-binding domain of CRP or a regulatory subunit of cAMP-dependent protein kinases n=1 Tax=Peptoniphilus asaccharolyticus DSM 20463 TaxID=573058 RepID=A0A1W1UY56_PEPAS|nr:Crp/Fnr family transcriptional regulator [Peptoniphilus asaccharolyticus]MBL7575347.1 Crp/Fnr family transcriptional regulator [Peptoniphilus asaccharolyticus]SMB86032.1 cAMP-binding domain of CRP or a regulatory subunit of cAMP-dependent protein kinases [Peptoniphilus asaccharolyticus DSM 20463]
MANKSNLFFNMDNEELEKFLKDSGAFIKTFKAGEYIFNQGDKPKYTFIIERGSVVVENVDSNGKKSIVNVFNTIGTVFGEVYMYLDTDEYDYSSYANEASEILFLPKESLVIDDNLSPSRLKIVNNMLNILANKSFFLNQKLLMMSAVTLREKLIKYILNHSEGNELILSLTREEMGNYLGVPRPSISRELMNMKKEELIEITKTKIIFDRENLKNLI